MSAIRNPATITSVGRRMMTAGGDITYTKAVLYGQDISHLTREQLESLTSIGNPLVTVPLGISDKNDNGNGTTVILEATFQNSNLKADLPYTAVGFFAKRGDDAEKLIAVGVATEGAYLAATSPDGVATDALDIKVAIAIGDSANVTAMIDPAGSVTPAALHNAITDVKSEMKTGLDTKADKQTVTDDLATKADKTDVDAQIGTVNKSVSDLSDTVKANKDDADKTLATKADKATVESDLATKANQSDLDKTNSEVAKKADSEDVNAQLATKANSKDVNAALALKDDTADVDDKISNVTKSVSDLSATVTANKKATDSTLATKANASDVADSLATKADKTDVASDVKSLNDAINTKASQADLDKTNAVVATKANATALADYARTVDVDADLDTKANKTDLESLAKTADVNSALDTKADKTTVDSDVKSINDTLATKADKQTVTDDLATKADKATVESELSTKANQSDLDKTNAEVAKKASTTDVNSQLATKADAKDVTDALALKDDTVDVDKKISNVTNSVNSLSSTVTSNKSATDTALGTKANANDVANSFEEVRNRVKKLEGQQELTAPDFNTLTSTGIYMIENPTNGKNSPSNGSWGTLVVSRGTTGSDSRILQEYYPDSGDLPYFRMSGPGGVWRDWKQLSDQSEINSLRDAVNTKADKTALDAYAKSADVANDVKTLQDNINAKADAQTVSDAISKIDLTPFAKTADVNSALSGKADKVTIDAINKALASKRDITDSYSRDELDKKFLQLSADTGGKVSADQVSKLIAGKADQDDVDKKIKAVTDAVNTKANSSDVTSLINSNTDKLTQTINAITYSAKERPLPSNDANEITEDGIYRVGGDPLKNGAGQQWDFLLVKKWDENTIYQMMYGGGKGIFIRNISKTGNSYPEWTRIDIDVNGLQNTLNAKANTADVNTALSKKDDITDVDAKIKTVTDLANSKVDATYSYSKAELDKKLLAVTTTADGKVGADQVAQMIAGKADKTYVDNQIATIDFGKIKFRKQYVNSDGQTADKTWSATKNKDGTYTIDLWQDDWTASKLSGVLAQLPNKADTSTVNAQIADAKNTIKSNVDNLQSAVNTKASQADFDSLKTLVNNVKGFNVDSFKGGIPTTDINKITDSGLYGFANQTLTNSPFGGSRWGLLFVLREYDNDANNIDQFITSNGNLYWRNISLTNSIYPSWKRFANDGDINSLQSAINTKANSSDLTALDKKAVKSVGIYPNNLHFESGSFNYWSGEVKAGPDANGYALIDLTDDTSVRAAADQLNVMLTGLNHLQGKQTKESADANALSETGIYYCSSPAKNFPVSHWGTLVTSNGNGARASQLYFPDDNSAVWFRTLDGDWRGWVRLANIGDVNNAESSLTSLINTKANAAQTTANAVSNKVNVTVPLFRRITAANTWNDILGASNGDTPVLVSIRDEGGANTLGNYSAAVAFGGGDTKGVLNVAYSDHTARIIGGNGNAPVWHEDIAWKSDISNLQNIINQQNQTIQSLTTRLANAENEINYIKANYVEGRRFPASQEAQAEAWENEKPTRLAMIEK